MGSAWRRIRAPAIPKLSPKLVNFLRTSAWRIQRTFEKEAVMLMNSDEGVTIISPAIAARKTESNDHLCVSQKVNMAQVNAPADAQRFVTTRAMTYFKFRLRVVPASNTSHESQMVSSTRTCWNVLCGKFSTLPNDRTLAKHNNTISF
jgi:hypothetical protein